MGDQAQYQHKIDLWKLMLAAGGTTILLSTIALLLPVLYSNFFYGTIQFIWPLLSLLLLIIIYHRESDSYIKRFVLLFTIAMTPWTITVLLWEVVLPQINGSSLMYYVSGFGYLLGYFILLYGLQKVRHSRQWYLSPSINLFTNIIGIVATVSLLIFIIPGIQLSDPRALDMIILVTYIVSDVLIIIMCAKLMNMDIKDEMKYLVFIMGAFALVNFFGDTLYEIRWLLHESRIFSYKISLITDVIYTESMVFMTIALLFYLSTNRDPLLSTISRKISEARPYVQDIIANSPDAMFLCDEKGYLTMANEPLANLLKINRSALIGKFNFFGYLSEIDEHMTPAIEKIKKGESYSLSMMKFSASDNKSDIYVSLRLFPMRDVNKNIFNYAGIIQDITDQLHNEQELADSKRQIELYMDIMSHDINNINQIGVGHLEIAKEKIETDGKLGPENMHYIDKPLEAFMNSSRLISNIKLIKKVQSGEFQFEPVEVGEILDDIVKEHNGSVDRTVVINYTPIRGLRVKANYLLREVFSNLVGNAIKHSDPEKPLLVYIQAETLVRDSRKYYRILIEDDGRGVPDINKEAIFNRIQTGEEQPKGRGLGLYIVKALVESYGGRVWVEDRIPGNYSGGARFVVELPAEYQPRSLAATSEENLAADTLTNSGEIRQTLPRNGSVEATVGKKLF